MIYEVTKAYMEPHRKHHGLAHPLYMLKLLQQWGWGMAEDLCEAIWFHDFVYNVKAAHGENEKASAEIWTLYARRYDDDRDVSNLDELEEAIDVYRKQPTYGAIIDTAGHIPRSPLSEKLSDLDMAILGANEDIYTRYVMNTFLEYIPGETLQKEGFMHHPHRYDLGCLECKNDAWAKGRSAWIDRTLKQVNIFWTPDGKKLEEQAIRNLTNERKLYGG